MKAYNWIDYEGLWRDLVKLGEERRARKTKTHSIDQWHGKASEFEERVNARWQQKDSSRDFVMKTLQDFPHSSVLDIGAGSGAWVSFLAPFASSVTAIDPSDSMLRQLENRVRHEKFQNVKILKGCWPGVQVELHDISFCSHAMYGVENFAEFVQAIQECTMKRIILLIRAPKDDGLMAQAAKLVWGHPYDSPNYQIAINILWQMGIFPNVIMEDDRLWKPWSHSSLEDALSEMKNRLGLFDSQEWDEKLLDLLESRLLYESGEYIWPSALRTALLYWDV